MSEEQARIRLLKEYGINETGLWAIFGEDPNCDYGGAHHSPHLETVRGKYGDIVEYALDLPSFFTWGYGGRIAKQDEPKTIDGPTLKRTQELLKQKKELENRLDEINKELN